jgi:predicted alpha/beta hydrolase
MIAAWPDFVSVDGRLHQRWTLNHFFIAVWRAKEAQSNPLAVHPQAGQGKSCGGHLLGLSMNRTSRIAASFRCLSGAGAQLISSFSRAATGR